MLDAATKRRIDTARDILVGKVPDPKSQVEQITIALIYKFMDDIDAESEELGGQRQFFADGFARYGWAKLVRPGLGGHEMLNLYAEAITRMPENPGIPPLFRDIFNNAYLPYRDPETLRAFLKVIDEFSYDHSERLGDAFEYLLSVLGSQGDAGQFRTPRHIIDFIVSIVDPKKDEVVLDPACGTAGFLISSYKHILAANTGDDGISTLTPDEKGRLAGNFMGYDISPDMVRLSLVNMYLHGFVAPQISEYDTLTSDERWNEYADVILANPPFMSPKGGIRPHNRFSVKSKRSEVLFVDYIAEHLTPSGRAGIIVPEGIIFQSQKAHTALRKMLVEEYLVAVVSLPAGVFNPYSGVKTSILFLDRALAKRTDAIGFFKIENDGFDLGAQRRPAERDDLPKVQTELAAFLSRLRSGKTVNELKLMTGHVVAKLAVAQEAEYNLTSDRYRDTALHTTKYPSRRINELIETITPPVKLKKSDFGKFGRFPIIDQSQTDIAGWTSDESAIITPEKPVVIFGDHTCAVKLVDVPFAQGADGIKILYTNADLLPQFLYFILRARPLQSDGYKRHFTKLKETQVPLPPLAVQRGIVAEIEGYQRVIDGARAVVENYRPHVAPDPEWPIVSLGEVCSIDGVITRNIDHDLPYFGADSIQSDSGRLLKIETAGEQHVNGPVYEFKGTHILYSKIRPYLNKLTVVDLDGYCSSDMYPLLPDPSKVQVSYLAAYMLSEVFNKDIRQHYERASIPKINRSQLFKTDIPLPSLSTQQAIVAELETERALVAANEQLIERMEKKIATVMSQVWNGQPSTKDE